jgi:hypothetical protein
MLQHVLWAEQGTVASHIAAIMVVIYEEMGKRGSVSCGEGSHVLRVVRVTRL